MEMTRKSKVSKSKIYCAELSHRCLPSTHFFDKGLKLSIGIYPCPSWSRGRDNFVNLYAAFRQIGQARELFLSIFFSTAFSSK